jgi:protein ImuB
MATARIACVLIPLFPLAARLRSEPELEASSVAIFSGNGNAARVVAASRPARKAGVKPGLSLSQARGLVSALVCRGTDAGCEGAAQEALLEAAETLSPRVEDGGPGAAYLDVDGLERHFPSERALCQSLAAAAEAAGLPARVGIAGSKLAARVAAESPGSPTVVAAGGEAAFLAVLPVARLSPSPEIAETLERWGITTLGSFARLPEAQVESRLGSCGRELHRSARGIDPRPLVPRIQPPDFEEGMDLEWPLVTVEPFLFVARAALDRLAQRLSTQALACGRLTLTLRLEPDGVDDRAVALPAPTRDVKTLLTLVRLDLEKRPPGAPISGFRFRVHPDRPRQAQMSLFGPPAISPDRLATALARLAAELGLEAAGAPAPVDAHRPEKFALVPYDPPVPPDLPRPPAQGRGLLAVRALRPPLPLEVRTEETRPLFLSSPGPPPIEGAVRVASGPWRLEEAAWSEAGTQRDYWDVETSDGGLYRIYRDRRNGEWFADGVYD